jgi:hypothetical protein
VYIQRRFVVGYDLYSEATYVQGWHTFTGDIIGDDVDYTWRWLSLVSGLYSYEA